MKKNILIALLAATSLASLAYGYQQKQMADQARLLAERMTEEAKMQRAHAERNMEIAKRNEMLAIANAEEARRYAALAGGKK